jgi:hypothetical protein
MMLRTCYTYLVLALCIILSLPAVGSAQEMQPDSTLFNFWEGHWELTWTTQNGVTAHGTNHIERILDGRVLQENFQAAEDGPLQGYAGKSWSMIDKRSSSWKQTWVDSQGAYLPFTGGTLSDGTPYFGRKISRQGQPVWQRMRFLDIKPNAFVWIWESSKDSVHWSTAWKINYRRAQ